MNKDKKYFPWKSEHIDGFYVTNRMYKLIKRWVDEIVKLDEARLSFPAHVPNKSVVLKIGSKSGYNTDIVFLPTDNHRIYDLILMIPMDHDKILTGVLFKKILLTAKEDMTEHLIPKHLMPKQYLN